MHSDRHGWILDFGFWNKSFDFVERALLSQIVTDSKLWYLFRNFQNVNRDYSSTQPVTSLYANIMITSCPVYALREGIFNFILAWFACVCNHRLVVFKKFPFLRIGILPGHEVMTLPANRWSPCSMRSEHGMRPKEMGRFSVFEQNDICVWSKQK